MITCENVKIKEEIFNLIDHLPESEYPNLQQFLLFLKHKSLINQLEEDRKEELILADYSVKHTYKDSDSVDNIYDHL